MKNLFILRHAQAVNSKNNDIVRPLSDEGFLKCQDIALILEPYIKDIDLILSSSATRTKQTIENILLALKRNKNNIYYSKELYNISVNNLFQYLCDIEHNLLSSPNNLILVNHNPSVSQLGNFLAQHSLSSPFYLEVLKGFSPGSLALYQAKIDSWDQLDPSNVTLKKFWR